MLDFARCMRENGVDMPDPQFEGGRVTHADRRRRGEVDPDEDARRREGVREVPRRDQAARDVRRGQGGVQARRRWRTRAACASTASTCPTRRSTRTAARRSRLGHGHRTRSRPKFQTAAEGLRDTLPMGRQTTAGEDGSDEARSRLAGGAAVAAVAVGRRAGGRRRPEPARPRSRPPRARPRRSSGATSSTARTSPGTLGYADPGTLAAGVAGTLTGLREPGSRRHARALAVRGRRRAGRVPALRRRCRPGATSTPGMTDGEDVRQLERNLRALGYDPGDVDDDWDWETTDGGRGLPARPRARRRRHARPRRGRVPAGRDRGSARPKATVGDQVSPGPAAGGDLLDRSGS